MQMIDAIVVRHWAAVKVWRTALLMAALLCITLTVLPGAQPVWAGQQAKKSVGRDLYVSPRGDDRHNGSAKQPWLTMQHAALMAQPGDTVHVLPGMYRETIVQQRSGTAIAPIRFVSDKLHEAVIANERQSSPLFDTTGDYVEIVGFMFEGHNSCAGGIWLEGSYQAARNNLIQNIIGPGSGINSHNYNGGHNVIEGNTIYNMGGRTYAIYVANPYTIVRNNLVLKTAAGHGIHLWHAASDDTIVHNTVIGAGASGILVGCGDAGSPPVCDRFVVSNNIVVASGGPSIREYRGRENTLGCHSTYQNNLLYGNAAKPELPCGNSSGTIEQDPQFVSNTGTPAGDYHVRAGSPAIGRGVAQGTASRDMEDSPRANTPTIGAFEFRATTISSSNRPSEPSQSGESQRQHNAANQRHP